MNKAEFTDYVSQMGDKYYRTMPWREDTRPYYVLVSELMLQQTQVGRVIPKFEAFVQRFPNEQALARASLAEVLTLWQGLGYNRRARYLHDSAKVITAELNGEFPRTSSTLQALPGVGKNTAGAILAYGYNHPAIFVETNVRTVYIHHFFKDRMDVTDKEISDLLLETIDHEHPREFYWALMDYGSHLKASGVRNISVSKHYKKQSVLEGSSRQMRGMILRQLAIGPETDASLKRLYKGDERYDPAVQGLIRDGLVEYSEGLYHLTN